MIREAVDSYLFTESFPLIVEIPDRSGRDLNRPGIKELVNRAIGIKV
jgi:vacuolar-type H+-ATPase subunit F/Vma7